MLATGAPAGLTLASLAGGTAVLDHDAGLSYPVGHRCNRIVSGNGRHELPPEFTIGIKLHFAEELVRGGLVRELIVGAPVGVQVGA